MDAGVKQLLDLKAQYKKLTGTDFPTPGGKTPSKKEGTTTAKKQREAIVSCCSGFAYSVLCPKERLVCDMHDVFLQVQKDESQTGLKKQTRLGLEAKKEENLADWYSQVLE